MASIALPARQTYLNAGATVKSWLLTTDHKRIAVMYLFSVMTMFTIGAAAAGVIRLELVSPTGWLIGPDTYNRMFSMHGIIMIFFFLVPAVPAILGNFLVPLMIGARDLAFPRLNLASWYVYMTGAIFTLWAIFTTGIDTGWTFYTPYSTQSSTGAVVLVTFGIFILGFSSIMTALNFIITMHKMRAPGLTWFRMPLFLWSMYATSVVIVLATPVVAISLLLVAAERLFGLGIFNPALGGDPVLYQHLFWFYSHPAVYIMVLPAMGIASDVISTFARKTPFGYKFIALSSIAIAVLGFLVWGHHMFVAGQSVHAALMFSFLSYLVAIPSAVKVFNWTATLHKASVLLASPMLYVLGFVGLFMMGGLTGLMLAALAVDVHVNDTYFIVAHFHYVMVGGSVMAFIGGLHYWWPKITGRLYNDRWARIAAILMFIGFNLTFFPQFIAGYNGMPRRYYEYAPEFQIWNVMSSLGAVVLGISYIIPLFYLIPSLWRGERAPNNPWGSTTLEWQTSSPPPTYNFVKTPVVTGPPYDYSKVVPRGEES